jgi:hypothetical protein
MIKKLQHTAVKCENLGQYFTVRGLYMLAGAEIWPWHKGYKQPEMDVHETPFYGWENSGFMKHIFPVPESLIITIEQLAFAVLFEEKQPALLDQLLAAFDLEIDREKEARSCCPPNSDEFHTADGRVDGVDAGRYLVEYVFSQQDKKEG